MKKEGGLRKSRMSMPVGDLAGGSNLGEGEILVRFGGINSAGNDVVYSSLGLEWCQKLLLRGSGGDIKDPLDPLLRGGK